MEFCPKCKSMLFPIQNRYICKKCGFEKDIEKNVISTTERKEREVTIIDQKDRGMGLPTIKARCTQCNNDIAFWWMRQLRSADESEVRFFRCTKCGNTWREYNQFMSNIWHFLNIHGLATDAGFGLEYYLLHKIDKLIFENGVIIYQPQYHDRTVDISLE